LQTFKNDLLELVGPRAYPTPRVRWLETPSGVEAALPTLMAAPGVAIDVETLPKPPYTGREGAAPEPVTGQIRRIQLCIDPSEVLLLDTLKLDPRLLDPMPHVQRRARAGYARAAPDRQDAEFEPRIRRRRASAAADAAEGRRARLRGRSEAAASHLS